MFPKRLISLTVTLVLWSGQYLTAAPPFHEVRGHGIWDLEPVDYYINQISINAWQDDTGVHGHACWLTNYWWGDTQERGWVWEMDIVDLYFLDETTVFVTGVITLDTIHPEWDGGLVYFVLRDNGSGRADPPDELLGYPIIGGNFTVR